MNLVHAQLGGDALGHILRVAGQHDGFGHAGLMQRVDGLLRMGLDNVGDDDVSGVFAVHRHVNDRAHAVTVLIGDPQLVHQLGVARRHSHAVHSRRHAVAADLLDVGHAAAVDRLAIGLLQAPADGMRRGALGQRGVLDQLFILQRAVMHAAHLKHAARQRAGLVKHDGPDPRERLKIVRALDQYALPAGAADARKERQRYAHDQRARAAGDQKCQRAVEPDFPLGAQAHYEPHDGRQHRQRQRGAAHGRRIDARELGDEVLGARLARAGIFDQLQNLRDGRFAEGLCRSDLQNAGHVDAAADDLVAHMRVAREALAGQRAGVERRFALHDHAVDGYLLARLHDDHRADIHLVGIDLHERTVLFDVGVVGADVHQGADVFAALAHRVALEQLAHLIE